jgi:NAD(P)H-dependent flavin oxidoreductase YrpB (nitropropane dioxygenase family)
VLATGLGSPAPYVDQVHAAGGKVISLVGNVKDARRVAEGGADVVVAQGHEAGGHTGRIGTMALLPQVLDAVSPRPVVAAGGIGDGRGLAAAFAIGCAGAWCGTAFIATQEANLDEARKRRILAASDEGTRVTRLYSGKTMRNITNELIVAWDESGSPALPMGLQTLLVTDLLEAAKAAGRDELLMNAAGQISGMLTEIRSAESVLMGIVSEAVEILTRRLPLSVAASPDSNDQPSPTGD